MANEPLLPTARQAREHRRLARASLSLTDRLRRTIPESVIDEIGEQLGLYDEGRFPWSDTGADFLADCCLLEPAGDGPSLLRAYAESADAARLPPRERRLLELWQTARYALLRVDEVWPGIGLRVHDELERRDLTLLNRVVSREPGVRGLWLVARIFEAGGYWMATEALMVLGRMDDDCLRIVHEELDGRENTTFRLATLALVVRAEQEEELEGRGEEGEEEGLYDEEIPDLGSRPGFSPQLPRRAPGRNEPCPCGSGKKYKKCCALAPRPPDPPLIAR